jgi:hypothetical protein
LYVSDNANSRKQGVEVALHSGRGRHLLIEELMVAMVKPLISMLETLEQQKPMNCSMIITKDESWFPFDNSRNHVERVGDDNAPEPV